MRTESADFTAISDKDFLIQRYVNDYQKQNELQQTRRMLEVYNSETLRTAAGKELLTNQNFFRDKISKYLVHRNSN